MQPERPAVRPVVVRSYAPSGPLPRQLAAAVAAANVVCKPAFVVPAFVLAAFPQLLLH